LRSVVVLVVLAWYSQRIEVFFAYQVLVAVLEVFLLRHLFLQRFQGREHAPLWPRFRSLGVVFRFAGAMALLALIWGVISQADRLVLSHYLSLADYGRYAVAMVAASGVTLLATPLIQAVQPRMVFLAAGKNIQAMHELYRTSTQLLMCLLLVVAGCAIFFAEPILRIWTGNAVLATQMAPVLALYALGNALLALSSLVFQLQYACGLVRRHVLGSLGFGVIWVPLMCLMAIRHGAIGAAGTWFAGNLLFFILWMLGTQRRLMPGQTMNWLWADVLRGPLAAVPVYFLFIFALPLAVGRVGVAVEIGACAVLAALTGVLASPRLRAQAGAGWRRYRVSVGKRIDE
jgi:O-antigen/teichoic acid export membrane protein